MNENIDLRQLLKDCPKGFKLYSKVHGEVEFAYILEKANKPIVVIATQKDNNETYYKDFTANGCLYSAYEVDECLLVPSKEQQDWSKFSAPWLKKDKFDPKTLKPFDKVLVRDYIGHDWKCNLFSHIDKFSYYIYICVGNSYVYCIPYNDETKHLVGTTNEAPEYYRYWEE